MYSPITQNIHSDSHFLHYSHVLFIGSLKWPVLSYSATLLINYYCCDKIKYGILLGLLFKVFSELRVIIKLDQTQSSWSSNLHQNALFKKTILQKTYFCKIVCGLDRLKSEQPGVEEQRSREVGLPVFGYVHSPRKKTSYLVLNPILKTCPTNFPHWCHFWAL